MKVWGISSSGTDTRSSSPASLAMALSGPQPSVTSPAQTNVDWRSGSSRAGRPGRARSRRRRPRPRAAARPGTARAGTATGGCAGGAFGDDVGPSATLERSWCELPSEDAVASRRAGFSGSRLDGGQLLRRGGYVRPWSATAGRRRQPTDAGGRGLGGPATPGAARRRADRSGCRARRRTDVADSPRATAPVQPHSGHHAERHGRDRERPRVGRTDRPAERLVVGRRAAREAADARRPTAAPAGGVDGLGSRVRTPSTAATRPGRHGDEGHRARRMPNGDDAAGERAGGRRRGASGRSWAERTPRTAGDAMRPAAVAVRMAGLPSRRAVRRHRDHEAGERGRRRTAPTDGRRRPTDPSTATGAPAPRAVGEAGPRSSTATGATRSAPGDSGRRTTSSTTRRRPRPPRRRCRHRRGPSAHGQQHRAEPGRHDASTTCDRDVGADGNGHRHKERAPRRRAGDRAGRRRRRRPRRRTA